MRRELSDRPPLFVVGRRPRWTGSRELVVIPPGMCPVDGAALEVSTIGEVPLFRHGGYGAMLLTTRGVCPACRWSIVRQVQEVRP